RKSKTLKGATEEAIQQQRLQLQSAQNQLDKAKREFEQGQKLFEGGAISRSEWNDRKWAVDQAQIAVNNAKLAL
ncbi:efflux RND transporter periplasmic adaptor subunit, partial [Anoxybacillus sp. LAT27]|nr:efflux RND transporter periplasmic adaptor subunit [Anoxybacillus sp. LAT27]